MKKLTLSEWEEKYIVRPVERFDQKYIMFNRPSWNPEIKGLLKDWSTVGEVKRTRNTSGGPVIYSARLSARSLHVVFINRMLWLYKGIKIYESAKHLDGELKYQLAF